MLLSTNVKIFSVTGIYLNSCTYTKNLQEKINSCLPFIVSGTVLHGALRGSRQGLFPPRQFLRLHQPPGNDLTWPLSPTYPSWSEESAAAPAAGTNWPRLAPPSSERRWRPLTLDDTGCNVLYLISCQLRLIHIRSIDIWTSTALST